MYGLCVLGVKRTHVDSFRHSTIKHVLNPFHVNYVLLVLQSLVYDVQYAPDGECCG